MKIQLVRHATLILDLNGTRILVDPMLSPAEANPPIPRSSNDRRNPLVELPMQVEQLLDVDAVLITHLHPDHFDEYAAELLPRDLPILCQPQDARMLREYGFAEVHPIRNRLTWHGIDILRTGGKHGTGLIGRAMGPVSGFVLQAPASKSVYIAGDTIWCRCVRQALVNHRPDIVVVNAGAAQFRTGDPITMTADDVQHVCTHAPDAVVIAVHMDSINHCLLTRSDLRTALVHSGINDRVRIPEDGDLMTF